MIDFNYTAPELLPFRIQEVLDAPSEPHRIGGVVYVPKGGGECEIVSHYVASTRGEVGRERVKLSCGHIVERHSKYCQECGRKIRKAVER